jgi:hypothetical protein
MTTATHREAKSMGREGRNPGSGLGSVGGPVAVEVEVRFFHSSISILEGAALPPC